MERLDKYLCDCGVGTRSQVRQIIKAGRVSINHIPERDNGRKFSPETEIVTVDGHPLQVIGTVVAMMYKPAGYVTATEDPVERTVMELLPIEYRLYGLKPIGRLDKLTTGLLLFTNNGDLLHHIISPRHQIPKVYVAQHTGIVSEEDIRAFQDGVILADGTHCMPAKLEKLSDGCSRITVFEGQYHQVRRMMASRGMHVEELERMQEGSLTLTGLQPGQVRLLSDAEIASLY